MKTINEHIRDVAESVLSTHHMDLYEGGKLTLHRRSEQIKALLERLRHEADSKLK